MLDVFLLIFVANTKISFRYDFAAPLKMLAMLIQELKEILQDHVGIFSDILLNSQLHQITINYRFELRNHNVL